MDPVIEDKYKTNLLTLDFSDIFINKIGHMADQPNQFFTNFFVRHDFCLQYVIGGKGEFFVNNKLYALMPGTLFLLPKQKYHYYKADKNDPYEYYWIHFNGNGFTRFMETIGLSEDNPVLYGINNPAIRSVFEELIELSISPKNHDKLLILSKSYQLLYEIAVCIPQNQSEQRNSSNEIVERIVNYISENFTRPLNLDMLSELVHINKCYLISVFKRHTGISPIQYLIQYRISNACQLLRTDRTISEIAAMCGFQELTNFLIRFKKITGLTPSQYRKYLILR